MGAEIVIQGIARNVEWEERQDRQTTEGVQTTREAQRTIQTTHQRQSGSSQKPWFAFRDKHDSEGVTAGTTVGDSTAEHRGESTSDSYSQFATALTFRVERTDENGDSLPPISVRIHEEAADWKTSRLRCNHAGPWPHSKFLTEFCSHFNVPHQLGWGGNRITAKS